MEKKTLLVAVVILVLSLSMALFACHTPQYNEDDTVYAYCSKEYSAGYGNGGTFSIAVFEGAELEDEIDVSKVFLGGAFKDMKISEISFAENGYEVIFNIEGSLVEGEFGTVSSGNIIKKSVVNVNVPINKASAGTRDVVYSNEETHSVAIELMDACFEENITPDDFVLGGAAAGLEVESVTNEYYEENETIVLGQTATVTFVGQIDDTDYVYIDISSDATTYNATLSVVAETDYKGIDIINEYVDTYKDTDTIYVKAHNITFKNAIALADITFGGELKDYVTATNVEMVDSDIIAIEVAIPYNHIDIYSLYGEVTLAANTNEEGLACSASVLLSTPRIEYNENVVGDKVNVTFHLTGEEFNLAPSAHLTVTDKAGTELIVSELDILDVGEDYELSFRLPAGTKDYINITIVDVYNIRLADGAEKSMDIQVKVRLA